MVDCWLSSVNDKENESECEIGLRFEHGITTENSNQFGSDRS